MCRYNSGVSDSLMASLMLYLAVQSVFLPSRAVEVLSILLEVNEYYILSLRISDKALEWSTYFS